MNVTAIKRTLIKQIPRPSGSLSDILLSESEVFIMKNHTIKRIICAGTISAMLTAAVSSGFIQAVASPDSDGIYFTNTFESGTENWSGRGSASVSLNSRNYYDGSGSLYVSGRESEWNGASIELDSEEFLPDESYSFSAAVLQTSGSDVTIQMSIQQGSGDSASYTHIADCTAKSGEWTKLENIDFTIPANTGDLILYIETPQDSGDLCSFYIDNVQVAQKGKSSSVVTGQGTVAQQQINSDTIKIMPVGDSITFGYGEAGGYRKYLYHALGQKGYTQIDMVGPEGPDSASFSYNNQNVTYDNNHAGYSGFTIKQQYPIPSWGENGLYERLISKDAVKQAQPDIILLIIGTNDMTANRPLDSCEAELHDLIDYMLADMPSDSMIFMGSIPEFTAYGGNAERIANYNSTVRKVAEDYAKTGRNVRFADVHGCLNGTADLDTDNLHPNGKGYEKMGNFWAEVIDEYILESQPVVTPPQTTTTTTTTVTTTTTTTTTTEPVVPETEGDVNGDGVFSISDVVLLQRWLLSTADKKSIIWENADVCKDNVLDAFDLCLMRKIIVEKR